jgi:cation:H+ antiporter
MSGAKSRASHHDVVAAHDVFRTVFLLVFGIAFLYGGSELFMAGLRDVAVRFHLDGGALGALIIAPGTSGPEIIVSIISIIRKRPAILVGNMVGSCISHVILVGGIAGVLAEPTVYSRDVLLMLLATIIFSIDIAVRHKIDRWNGVVYLALLCLYFSTVLV